MKEAHLKQENNPEKTYCGLTLYGRDFDAAVLIADYVESCTCPGCLHDWVLNH